jgi:hypothetical protein
MTVPSRWSVTLDGLTYRARPVSARYVADWWEKYSGAKGREQFQLLEAVFREAFPWRISYAWLGDPVKKIMALPLAEFMEIRSSFFGHLGGGSRTSVPATSGTT